MFLLSLIGCSCIKSSEFRHAKRARPRWNFQSLKSVQPIKWKYNDCFRCVLDKKSNLLFLMVEGSTVTKNVHILEHQKDTTTIRETSHAEFTTEVSHTMYKRTRTAHAQNILSRCLSERASCKDSFFAQIVEVKSRKSRTSHEEEKKPGR